MSNTTPSSRPSDGEGRNGYVRSYYAASANTPESRPPLEGNVTADVCIVGAGYTGISAGLALAERGFSVVVLEAERVGWGASGRNGGQIVNGYSRDIGVIARRYGKDKAVALARMSLEGGDIIRDRVARHGIACDLRPGNAFVAIHERQLRHLERLKADWEHYGHGALELVDRAGLHRIVSSDRYAGGLVDHRGGHMHPLNLVLGEAVALERLGGRIFERARVTAIEAGARPLARTAAGAVAADTLLLCGNAYLGGLVPQIAGKIMPVSSQQIATAPLDPALAESMLPANYAVEDTNYILDYYRRTPDNRVLYGGGVGYGGGDPADIAAFLRPRMLRTFPELENAKIEFAWSCNFALTLTRIPHVGRISPNVYFSHGDSGHGVTTTHLLGVILAETVAGQMERFDVWASLRALPFPGGRALRVPLTALGAVWYDMRDRLGV
jgi:gamma-glutamylputrescine oxidase